MASNNQEELPAGITRSSSQKSAGEPPNEPVEVKWIDLGPSFSKRSCWSNDPKDFDISTYFKDETPNLAVDFNISRLLPILRHREQDDFLLTDDADLYYLWNPWHGDLYRFDQGTTLENAVLDLTDGVLRQNLTQVFRRNR